MSFGASTRWVPTVCGEVQIVYGNVIQTVRLVNKNKKRKERQHVFPQHRVVWVECVKMGRPDQQWFIGSGQSTSILPPEVDQRSENRHWRSFLLQVQWCSCQGG